MFYLLKIQVEKKYWCGSYSLSIFNIIKLEHVQTIDLICCQVQLNMPLTSKMLHDANERKLHRSAKIKVILIASNQLIFYSMCQTILNMSTLINRKK